MIRRRIFLSERDPRSLKWSLIAAAFALTVGSYAEMVLAEGSPEDAAPVVADETAEPTEAPSVTFAG